MIRYLYCKMTKQPFVMNEGSGMMDAGIDAVLYGPLVAWACIHYGL